MSRGALPAASNSGACRHQRVSVSRTPRNSDWVSMARPVSACRAAIMAGSCRISASRNSSIVAARPSTPSARHAGWAVRSRAASAATCAASATVNRKSIWPVRGLRTGREDEAFKGWVPGRCRRRRGGQWPLAGVAQTPRGSGRAGIRPPRAASRAHEPWCRHRPERRARSADG